MDVSSNNSPGFRPRFSLLTAILLMTIVGLVIVIAQLWREVGPLRDENRRMRTELGQLTIEDPTRAYAISVPTFEDDTWKWRIYLPPGGQYSLCEYSGRLPGPNSRTGKPWFDGVRRSGSGSISTGTNFGGEFLLEAKLMKEGDTWYFVTSYTNRNGGQSSSSLGKSSINQSSNDWLSDGGSRRSSSDVTVDQKSFGPGTPILLLHMYRPVITETPGGARSRTDPAGPADGIAVWIEQPALTTPAAKK